MTKIKTAIDASVSVALDKGDIVLRLERADTDVSNSFSPIRISKDQAKNIKASRVIEGSKHDITIMAGFLRPSSIVTFKALEASVADQIVDAVRLTKQISTTSNYKSRGALKGFVGGVIFSFVIIYFIGLYVMQPNADGNRKPVINNDRPSEYNYSPENWKP